jgi:hypothetical protein
MSTYRIYKVHLEPSRDGVHDHIAAVSISENGDHTLRVSTVAYDLKTSGGDRYYTLGGGERANVSVRTCSRCTFRDYITTHPDSTTKNNLLKLPRF